MSVEGAKAVNDYFDNAGRPRQGEMWARGRASRGGEAAARSSAPGFTFNKTSDTPSDLIPTFDSGAARLKRMKYNVCASAILIDSSSKRGGFRTQAVMATLTYREVGQENPRDISEFLKRARQWCARRRVAFRYVWVGELQQRGALHYHVILWLPLNFKIPMPDKSGWWPHGRSNIKVAKYGPGYLAKYASKLETKGADCHPFPAGFRLYGRGGLGAEQKLRLAWANLPAWMRQLVHWSHECVRVSGGFVSDLTREFWPTPYRLGSIVPIPGGAMVSLVPDSFYEGKTWASSSLSLR